ncbi:SCO0607 family lipoprotein [Streptomyces gelaticus]|uniref:SCO0607 family lipoprotein n=1 Tax=Streptomyces gelaticus TaxID=285446 RepID=UPI00379C2D73
MYGISTIGRAVTARGGRRASRSAAGLALVAATVAILTTGCSMQDAICGGGEYPVMTIGGTGSACVPDDEDPPKGYVRYPKGKVPEHVDDKWDMYWRTHSVDRSGRIIEVPAGS